jgi:hypothetical protein
LHATRAVNATGFSAKNRVGLFKGLAQREILEGHRRRPGTLSRSSIAFFIVGLNPFPPVSLLSLSVWNRGQTIFLILTGGASQAFEILNNFRTPEELPCGSSLAQSALNLVFCYDGIKAAVITVRLRIAAFGSIG